MKTYSAYEASLDPSNPPFIIKNPGGMFTVYVADDSGHYKPGHSYIKRAHAVLAIKRHVAANS